MRVKHCSGETRPLALRSLLNASIMGLIVASSTIAKGGTATVATEAGLKVWVARPTAAVRLDARPPAEPVKEIDWAAARQESEHAQICLRSDVALSGLRVLFDDLRGPQGTIARENLTWRQVGYVDCRPMPEDYGEWLRYEAEPGWWPDPLLEVEEFDLEPAVTQPVWVTVRVPAGTAAGTYEGKAQVVSDAGQIAALPMKLEVWPIDLPNPGRFDAVFSFYYPFENGPDWQDVMTKIYGEFTPELKKAYFEFLGEHRIPADHLYLERGPRPLADYEQLLACGGKRFNLIYAADKVERITEMLDRITPTVAGLEQRGLLGHAYVYGFDEHERTSEPVIREVFGAVKQRWPHLRTMAVLNWEPPVDLPIDTWVVIYSRHDPQAAARWRAAGKEYWWYHCCGPIDPHMNTFVEQPRINGRLMMWLAAANEVNGWLYYTVNGWPGERKIVEREGKGPRTDFDPATWRHSNGDGNFIYPGKDGPLSCTRLENLTDGIEDWELFAQLREESRLASEGGGDGIVSGLTSRLVRSSTDRTPDPELLEATRREAAKRLVELRS